MIQGLALLDIVIVSGDWHVACWIGDTEVQPDSTPGVMRSRDAGTTWTFLDAGLFPSRLVWRLESSPAASARLHVGMWGGGFLRLED